MKNTIKKIGSAATMFVAVAIFTTTSCKKSKIQGCMDKNSYNYNSSAEEDDGSCKYKGSMVFWWNATGQANAAAAGYQTIKVYADGVFQGALSPSSQSWTAAPSCGASSTITINQDFGSNKTKNIALTYKVTTAWGATDSLMTSWSNTETLEANTCIAYDLSPAF